jgi:hypothetical protein
MFPQNSVTLPLGGCLESQKSFAAADRPAKAGRLKPEIALRRLGMRAVAPRSSFVPRDTQLCSRPLPVEGAVQFRDNM